ncbi:MAG TPA: Holliday junction branch migration DNA helicase RuvB [Candidatus Dojkabacteria bacterium]|nr:Holliday junction branch migration DNA helicase RuvB [Candidatus Dojkabacteria bacterium]HRP36946.1 Holliday junction branch migration DNA helicase RuvB [Candidatus Dojkabacteria bacterium]HRP51594.1 Holliday junction branch migration DNA helicase RuvB [Candidatus Dojkabacteria bacterium]
MMNDRIINAESESDDELVLFDRSLRPKLFKDVIGRKREVDNLKILIDAAKMRNEPIDHVLLHGPPGLGKTSLAYVIANEANVPIYTTSGPAIERKADLAAILSNLEDKAILFIDEIHRLNRSLEEILYSAMEDSTIDIVIGKGPSARTLKLELNKFSLIGATTRVGMLSSPLRDRFGVDMHLDYYGYEDLASLIRQKAKILDIVIDEKASEEIAKRSRRTPRIAQRLLKRVRDYAQSNSSSNIDVNSVKETLNMLGIDNFGLDSLDKKILQVMVKNFKGGPVGINTIAASLSEDRDTIENVYEPFLLKEGFIMRTARGRVVTEKVYEILDL